MVTTRFTNTIVMVKYSLQFCIVCLISFTITINFMNGILMYRIPFILLFRGENWIKLIDCDICGVGVRGLDVLLVMCNIQKSTRGF